jgi:N-formylglutamate deformylase
VTGPGRTHDGPSAVLHIPHSSTTIPSDLRDGFALNDAALDREVLRLTDHHTDELVALDPAIAISVVFGVSRLVVDPERFSDDAREPMAARGMGAVYRRTTDGAPLRAGLTAADRAALLARFYAPHHGALDAAVQSVLDGTGRCLIIDCHSFPSEPLPCDVDQEAHRPDVCIGTDEFHTPAHLAADAVDAFAAHGLTVAVNSPFAGALVPMRWYQRDTRVSAVMVEINRRLYMDEATGEKASGFAATAVMVRSVLTALIGEYASRVRRADA